MEIDTEDVVDPFGIFGRFDVDITSEELLDELLPILDTCVVTRGDQVDLSDDDDDVIPVFVNSFEYLSAGDSLTLTSPAGTFANLQKINQGTIIGYGLGDSGADILAPAPNGLVLDIPGDEFPAYTNIVFPDVPPIDVTLSTGFALSQASVFTWTPGGNPNAIVDIFATSFNGTTARVECTVADDGSFEFPQATKDLMLTTFRSNFPGFARSVYSVTQDANSTLLLINTVADD